MLRFKFLKFRIFYKKNELTIMHVCHILGCLGQLVTCLVEETCLTADPGVASLIQARSQTFMGNDHEIISTANFVPSADSRSCQLQAKVCARSTH